MKEIIETFGCNPSKKDLRDFKLNKKIVKAIEFPQEYSLNNLPTVKSQGSVCSCVAHAMSSILEYHDKNRIKLSTNFIYGIRNELFGSTGEGMMLREALKISHEYGDMIEEDCKGNTEVEAVFPIAEEAFIDNKKLRTAYKYKIKKYALLLTQRDIKYAIMNYGPVLGSINWKDGTKYNKETGFVDIGKNNSISFHATLIYGWDKDGWLCQNSWGSYWGSSGRFKLRYSDGPIESFSIIDDDTLDSDSEIIVDPTHKSTILDLIYKFFNKIINIFK